MDVAFQNVPVNVMTVTLPMARGRYQHMPHKTARLKLCANQEENSDINVIFKVAEFTSILK